MFIYIHIISYYKLFLYFISKCNIGQSLMFIYIHIISYYKLFLYFNMCLSVKSNSLLYSFTSFLTSIQGLPSSGFELYCSNYKNVLYILILICGIYQLSKWAFRTWIWNGIHTSCIVFLCKSNEYVPSITLWFGDCTVFSCVCQDHVYCIVRENYILLFSKFICYFILQMI